MTGTDITVTKFNTPLLLNQYADKYSESIEINRILSIGGCYRIVEKEDVATIRSLEKEFSKKIAPTALDLLIRDMKAMTDPRVPKESYDHFWKKVGEELAKCCEAVGRKVCYRLSKKKDYGFVFSDLLDAIEQESVPLRRLFILNERSHEFYTKKPEDPVYVPPARPIEEIDADLVKLKEEKTKLSSEIDDLLQNFYTDMAKVKK